MKQILRTTFSLLLIFIILTSIPAAAQEPSHVPPKLSDGWEVSSLEAEGIEAEPIIAIGKRIRDVDDIDRVLAMAIVKNGKLVFEAYSPYVQRNTLHWLASITKAMTSTLIGLAIDNGYIENVDAPVADLIPEYVDAIQDPRFKKITLRHLMTMSSGLEWNEQISYNNPANSEWQMVESEDWIRNVLSKKVIIEPGTRFLYNTGGIHLLSAVIKSTTGLFANEFAEKHLFHPIGIRAYQWNRDIRGYPSTGGVDGGLGLRTRDLAKIGYLFMNEGKWQGKQVISKQWVDQATKKYPLLPGGNAHYSFNWFAGTGKINGISYEYKAAFGYGGQVLYVVPEKSLLFVINSSLSEGGSESRMLTRQILEAAIR